MSASNYKPIWYMTSKIIPLYHLALLLRVAMSIQEDLYIFVNLQCNYFVVIYKNYKYR